MTTTSTASSSGLSGYQPDQPPSIVAEAVRGAVSGPVVPRPVDGMEVHGRTKNIAE
ncbi:hypothetical protein [Streptomyces monashensis]|uniref:hypothetical protein n=1 Tax=Streptomyces monashensis TaxID=1678012 RepID=UPI0015A6C4E5